MKCYVLTKRYTCKRKDKVNIINYLLVTFNPQFIKVWRKRTKRSKVYWQWESKKISCRYSNRILFESSIYVSEVLKYCYYTVPSIAAPSSGLPTYGINCWNLRINSRIDLCMSTKWCILCFFYFIRGLSTILFCFWIVYLRDILFVFSLCSQLSCGWHPYLELAVLRNQRYR